MTERTEWARVLEHLPNAHILQSWEWGALKSRYGWTPSRILWCDENQPLAAAQVLRRRLPHTPFGVLYIPKGPVLDHADPLLLDATLAAVEKIAAAEMAIFVKIDPDIVVTDTVRAPEVLARRGWRISQEQIQFKNTVLLPLDKSEADLLAGMKPKTRYNIRLAERRGVQIKLGTRDDLAQFYSIYAETGARDGFLIRSFEYYRDVWGSFLEADLAQLVLARVGAELIAGLILFFFGNRAWYFYGASRSAHRELMPNHLLQWHAICLARERGCSVYDFWGAPDVLDTKAPMYGVYRFKEGFGGQFTRTVGAFDYVVNPLLYFLYAVVRPRYLALLRTQAPHTLDPG